jgi:hypothetical protein
MSTVLSRSGCVHFNERVKGMPMAESRDLPGWPKKRLVKEVRRRLASYGVRPSLPKVWLETWQWANQITNSYVFPRWPLPSEVAAQYMFLLRMALLSFFYDDGADSGR